MSFEGYIECLCEKGHRWSVSCYDYHNNCNTCYAKGVWQHTIDNTNG